MSAVFTSSLVCTHLVVTLLSLTVPLSSDPAWLGCGLSCGKGILSSSTPLLEGKTPLRQTARLRGGAWESPPLNDLIDPLFEKLSYNLEDLDSDEPILQSADDLSSGYYSSDISDIGQGILSRWTPHVRPAPSVRHSLASLSSCKALRASTSARSLTTL
jgi:hypothetical protein